MAIAKHKPKVVPTKLSIPLVLFLCLATFYGGYLLGDKPLTKLPDIRITTQTSDKSEVGHLEEVKTVEEKSASVQEGDEEAKRRLAFEEPKAPVTISAADHGETGDDTVVTIPFQLLSWHPRAYIFPNFAPPEKCDEIVAQARLQLTPSGLALRRGETAESTKDVRTSSGTFMSSSGNPNGALAWVENKIARVTMVPANHGEAYNVLRYDVGQKYDSHYDVFNPKEYGPQKSNRIASFLLYLTDVEEGGETMFPYENFQNMNINYNYKDCIGLKVKPKKGDGLLFWSMLPNGTIDETALHGSCPVVKGEKFVATKWIRDQPARLW